MDTIAAVTTGKGMAAISLIEVAGSNAGVIIREIFKPMGKGELELKTGSVVTGRISDGASTIDHVVLAVNDGRRFEIGCHGNPLIVEKIVQLLASKGVTVGSTRAIRVLFGITSGEF